MNRFLRLDLCGEPPVAIRIDGKAFHTFTRGFEKPFDRALMKALPAADVAPVVHGRWIKDNDSFQTDDYYCCYFDYTCSECGEIVNDRYKLPNYCPDCGAKMDGETEGK